MNAALPSDVCAVGLVLDRGHMGCVRDILSCTLNTDVIALLQSWRRLTNFPFCVIAGGVRRDDGAVGGLAADWDRALVLFRFASRRLGDSATEWGHSFTSAWLMFVSDERRAQLRAVIAQTQETVGSA